MSSHERRPIVLVVDDDPATRLIAREGLEAAGFEAHEAGDGEAALQTLSVLHPDIVVMDVIMPIVDGFEACRRLRRLPGGTHLPVLMITGLDDTASIKKAYEAGATDFATKPINFVLLAQRLRYMLRAKTTADALRASRERLTNAQRIAKLCHWEWEQGQGIHWSQEAKRLLGLPSLKLVEEFEHFLALVPGDDRDKVQIAVAKAWDERCGYSLEHDLACPDGALRVVYQEAEFIQHEETGRGRLVGTLQDVTERRRAEQRIERLTYYHKVTGLPNRVLLKKQLTEILAEAKRSRRRIAVLSLHLEQIKSVNDSFGHSIGDELLRQLAERLKVTIGSNELPLCAEPSTRRRPTILAHPASDEFVVVVGEIQSPEEVAALARRIAVAIARPISAYIHKLCLSCRVGISLYPEDDYEAGRLIEHSSAALRSAKGEETQQIRFYTAAMNERLLQRLTLEAELSQALERDQFMLCYQPKVALSAGRVVGVEALVRWEHPERGRVSPGEFISVAEESGLIGPLGEWIFRTACEQSIAWQRQGCPILSIAVNLSTAQFCAKDLHLRLGKALKETGADPRLLEIEITESLLLDQAESALETVRDLRKLGLRVAIDDFGTGYSSLAYLKRFSVDTLKIDQSFIRGIALDPHDATIVGAVIAMAHGLGLGVVAEGVENLAQIQVLRAKGCDQAQGFYYAPPLGADEMKCWLRNSGEWAVA
ncbi:MAG: putative bifunctional diguanylate cyclase/phosphodiesterase [Gammaproteobacteria bacterium]